MVRKILSKIMGFNREVKAASGEEPRNLEEILGEGCVRIVGCMPLSQSVEKTLKGSVVGRDFIDGSYSDIEETLGEGHIKEEKDRFGNLLSREVIVDGKQNGKSIKYSRYDPEVIVEEGIYKEDLREGKHIFYGGGENLARQEIEFRNDKKEGKYVEYGAEGVVRRVGNYKNDLEEGLFESFDKEGNLTAKSNYEKGVLRERVFYDERGNPEKRSIFIDEPTEGKTLEHRAEFFPNGNISSEGYYMNTEGYFGGIKEGQHSEYYDNGERTIAFFKDGKALEGTVVRYGEDGEKM